MPATYRYPLQSLQDLREAELSASRAALAEVEQRIEFNEHEIGCCQDSISDTEESLRLGQAKGIVQLEQHRVARLYLDYLQREMSRLTGSAAALAREKEQCMDDLKNARSALRMLELHRARLASEHAINNARRQQSALDDGWVSRAQQRGGPA